jgi:hypothetical protein
MDSALLDDAIHQRVVELNVKDIEKMTCPLCFKRFWRNFVLGGHVETTTRERRIMKIAAQFMRYPQRIAWLELEDTGSPLSDKKLLQELFANPEGFQGCLRRLPGLL